MPTLYIMCGLPFSGKTTLAKVIAEKVGAKMIAFDEMWASEKPNLVPDMDDVDEWKYVLKKAHAKIKESLRDHTSVVYDDVNQTKDQRDVLRNFAYEVGAKSVTIYLNTPMDLINQRMENNKVNEERHEVASVNIEKALKWWEDPLKEDGVTEYKPEMNQNGRLKKLGNTF